MHGLPVLSTRFERNGQALFAYNGDGDVTPATRRLFKGVQTLVHECYAIPGHQGPAHVHIEAVLEVAAEAGAQRLILVHQRADQRSQIAEIVNRQNIFRGTVLMPVGRLTLTVG